MAIRGRKPKPDNEKVNRGPVLGWIEVPDVPFEPQEEHQLGAHPGNPPTKWTKRWDRKWAPATLAWWDAVSRMPHCILWGPEQWQFARSAALVYDRWVKGDNARAAEIPKREKVMGTTFDARRDLRIRYVNPKAFEAPVDVDDGAEVQADRMADFEAERRRRLLDG